MYTYIYIYIYTYISVSLSLSISLSLCIIYIYIYTYIMYIVQRPSAAGSGSAIGSPLSCGSPALNPKPETLNILALRPVHLLRVSLRRVLESNFPGDSL